MARSLTVQTLAHYVWVFPEVLVPPKVCDLPVLWQQWDGMTFNLLCQRAALSSRGAFQR